MTVESETTEILHEKNMEEKCLPQKFHGEMSHSKNIQIEKSYDAQSDIKTFTGKTDIKKLDGNNLIAKYQALKMLTTLII